MLTRGYDFPEYYLGLVLIGSLQRGDPLEVSLSMVPPDHKLIPPKSLEAEASGLLDRMLAVFQENIRSVSYCPLSATN